MRWWNKNTLACLVLKPEIWDTFYAYFCSMLIYIHSTHLCRWLCQKIFATKMAVVIDGVQRLKANVAHLAIPSLDWGLARLMNPANHCRWRWIFSTQEGTQSQTLHESLMSIETRDPSTFICIALYTQINAYLLSSGKAKTFVEVGLVSKRASFSEIYSTAENCIFINDCQKKDF